ncbi:MAG: hypothetical protein FD122_170 [Stygiobacter sp.]|nr:MAG: hypothetical protein FD122_170 [Stygiobacter sp.]KAF0217667.1 MAG: hypothetical protein FD178_479 [Ignavibacteria bacterium]
MGLLSGFSGPSKDEVWSQLSNELGAEFSESGFFKNGKVILDYNNWEITLDTYTVHTGKTNITYTRMRAPYVNKDGFRFTIYRKSVFSWLGKMFGKQDIELCDTFFDENFIIQGEPEGSVIKLFSNRKIKELIQLQPQIHLQVKDDEGWFSKKFPEGVDELYFQVVGVIKDKERLKSLFDLFAIVLEELCKMGSAYESAPDFSLNE